MAINEENWLCDFCTAEESNTLYSNSPGKAFSKKKGKKPELTLVRPEAAWDCSGCGSENVTEDNNCRKCGSPRKENEETFLTLEGILPPPVEEKKFPLRPLATTGTIVVIAVLLLLTFIL